MKNRKLKDRKCPSLSLSVFLCLTVSICSLPSPWWVWSRSAAVRPPDSCCWCNSPWRSHKACLEDPHLSRRDHCHACPPLCVRLSSCKYCVLISAWWLCAFKAEAGSVTWQCCVPADYWLTLTGAWPGRPRPHTAGLSSSSPHLHTPTSVSGWQEIQFYKERNVVKFFFPWPLAIFRIYSNLSPVMTFHWLIWG